MIEASKQESPIKYEVNVSQASIPFCFEDFDILNLSEPCGSQLEVFGSLVFTVLFEHEL